MQYSVLFTALYAMRQEEYEPEPELFDEGEMLEARNDEEVRGAFEADWFLVIPCDFMLYCNVLEVRAWEGLLAGY